MAEIKENVREIRGGMGTNAERIQALADRLPTYEKAPAITILDGNVYMLQEGLVDVEAVEVTEKKVRGKGLEARGSLSQ